MEFEGDPSCRIHVDRWSQKFEIALWIRHSEGITTAPGPRVPRALLGVGLPDVSPTADGRGEQFATGWSYWWDALLDEPQPTFPPASPRVERLFDPPVFPGLSAWPAFQELVQARFWTAAEWANARKTTAMERGDYGGDPTSAAVVALNQAVGRDLRAFTIRLLVLPVTGGILTLGPAYWLVPEQLYEGPQFPDLFVKLAAPLA